jgi:hypothetical protein
MVLRSKLDSTNPHIFQLQQAFELLAATAEIALKRLSFDLHFATSPPFCQELSKNFVRVTENVSSTIVDFSTAV